MSDVPAFGLLYSPVWTPRQVFVEQGGKEQPALAPTTTGIAIVLLLRVLQSSDTIVLQDVITFSVDSVAICEHVDVELFV